MVPPPESSHVKARKGRRAFSKEPDSSKGKIRQLYRQAQKEAQSATEAAGVKTAAPFLRKATAESALGAHLKSLQTTHDGLTVAPSDPKLLRRFQAGIPWVHQDREYRNEIHRPRPNYDGRLVEEVVVEEVVVNNERVLQEMPEEWKHIDIMDLLLEQEKIMKSFDEVFAIPAGEAADLEALGDGQSGDATAWVGGVPQSLVFQGQGDHPGSFDRTIMEQLTNFGPVAACSVRIKDGNKSWGLVTFHPSPSGESAASIVDRLVADSITVVDKDGPLQLVVNKSDVSNKMNESSGALAMMAVSQASRNAPHHDLKPPSTQTILRVMRCVIEANHRDMGSGSRSLTPADYKKFKDRVEKALYYKGKKAGLRMLDPDDIHLLYSLRPADPHEDFNGTMNELNKARGHIKVIFKMYCLEGASASKGVEGMGKNQFGIFCDETELDEDNVETGGYGMNLADIDRIFIRSNYDRRAESTFKVDDEPAAVPEESKKGRASPTGERRGLQREHAATRDLQAGRGSPTCSGGGPGSPAQDEDTSEMNLIEFVASLVRLARGRFRDPSLAERVGKLMELIAENDCFSAVDDEVCRRMETSTELEGIFKTHGVGLRKAFKQASQLDTTPEGDQKKDHTVTKPKKKGAKGAGGGGGGGGGGGEAEMDTIALNEWIAFLNMYGLLNAKLTMREARTIFVQTNLDDELYVQEDGNDASMIVYDEFLECVVRCGVATYDYEFQVFDTEENDGFDTEKTMGTINGHGDFILKMMVCLTAHDRSQ